MTQFGKVTIDDAIEITVQLGPASAACKPSHTGKARLQDLLNVIANPQMGASPHRRVPPTQQFAEAYRRCLHPTLG